MVCYVDLSAFNVLYPEKYDVDVAHFFFRLGSTWGHFKMFANTSLHLAFFHCISALCFNEPYYVHTLDAFVDVVHHFFVP